MLKSNNFLAWDGMPGMGQDQRFFNETNTGPDFCGMGYPIPHQALRRDGMGPDSRGMEWDGTRSWQDRISHPGPAVSLKGIKNSFTITLSNVVIL